MLLNTVILAVALTPGRQLFFADALIESNTLKRVYHYPGKHAANPVLKPETKDEIHAPFGLTKLDMGDVRVFEGRAVKLRFTVT